ncbi:queuosine precursor transporter [Pseudoroseicyclus sp. H15]
MRLLPAIIAMATLVVASNILVQFLLWDGFLTWGAFTYPFAFLVTDITNRVYGPAAARRVVLVGFATGIVCSLIGTQIQLEFGPAVVMRVAIASGAAFLAAQLLDITVFNRLRAGRWWRAPLVSTLASSTLDTAIFFTVAFAGFLSFGAAADAATGWAREAVPFLGAGPVVPLWVSLAVADWGVKLAIALVALIPFRLVVGQMMRKRTEVTPTA